MHLLLVEDNGADVALVREALKETQALIELSVVHDGAAALDFMRCREPSIQAPLPDLVLLDLNLPLKSGYEVLAELKQDAELRFIPVVILTTTANPRDINQCYELGANAYIVKPIELDKFLHLVKVTVDFWSACKFRTLLSD